MRGAVMPLGKVWRTLSGPVPLSLREVLDYVRPGGALPEETPPRREFLPVNITLNHTKRGVFIHLLPAILKPTEKRSLDLLSEWPWLEPARAGQLMGVGRSRFYQVLERLRGTGLVIAVDAEGQPLPGTFRGGLVMLARRDQTAVGMARQWWSAAPVKPEAPLT